MCPRLVTQRYRLGLALAAALLLGAGAPAGAAGLENEQPEQEPVVVGEGQPPQAPQPLQASKPPQAPQPPPASQPPPNPKPTKDPKATKEPQTPETRLAEAERCFAAPILELSGPPSRAHHVQFLPDGWHALSSGEDGVIRLWDLDNGKELSTFQDQAAGGGGGNAKECPFAVSPDGLQLLYGEGDGLCLWDLAGGRKIRHLAGSGPVCSLAFSLDGKLALSGGVDGVVRLWDLPTGLPVVLVAGQEEGGAPVRAVAFAPDGKRAYSGSHRGAIRVWEVERAILLKELRSKQLSPTETRPGYRPANANAAFSADGRRAIITDGTTISFWDLEKEVERKAFDGRLETVECLTISPDGKRALVGGWAHDKLGGRRSAARLWDLEAGTVIRTLRIPRHPGEGWSNINDVAFSPDGRYILTAGISADTKPPSTLFFWGLPPERDYQLLGAEKQKPAGEQ